ncbi:MAG: nitrite/sulfite reductase [Planctomycetota bacterium]|jgi:sulfite reductase beta subunit-like hemoprotein
MAVSKESKQEAIKRVKDGLDVWDDIFRYAKLGYSAISAEDHERLKWYGLYEQRPRGSGLFMMRIKIPAGRLTGLQVREIGRIARQYAGNTADITTRQDIQLHGLRIENIPDVFDVIYNRLGLYQQFACGDTPRNVTCCPLSGVDANEIAEAHGIAISVSHMFKEAGKEFSNLPRKLKIAIGGCPLHCHVPQINDIGIFGVTRKRNNKPERGFGLLVGGGLRNTPHFGRSLRVFLPPDMDLIRNVCRHIVLVYRQCAGLRHNRLRARLKFYVAEVGWQAFRESLEQSLGYKLEHDESIVFPWGASHQIDHLGIGKQNNGLNYVGVPVERGRLAGDDLIKLADLANRYSFNRAGRLVTTVKQNIILLNIPASRIDDLTKELDDAGLWPHQHPLRTSLVSCTGREFCNLAVVETKQRAKEILHYLEEHVQLTEPLSINISGCPNGCAPYQIADIGLCGVPMEYEGRRVDGFHVLLGAKVGEDPRFARFVETAAGKKLKVPSVIVHYALEHLIRTYLAEDINDGGFAAWSRNQDTNRLAMLLCPDLVSIQG